MVFSMTGNCEKKNVASDKLPIWFKKKIRIFRSNYITMDNVTNTINGMNTMVSCDVYG